MSSDTDHIVSSRLTDHPYLCLAQALINGYLSDGLTLEDIRRVIDHALWLTERQMVIQPRRSAETDIRNDTISHPEALWVARIERQGVTNHDDRGAAPADFYWYTYTRDVYIEVLGDRLIEEVSR